MTASIFGVYFSLSFFNRSAIISARRSIALLAGQHSFAVCMHDTSRCFIACEWSSQSSASFVRVSIIIYLPGFASRDLCNYGRHFISGINFRWNGIDCLVACNSPGLECYFQAYLASDNIGNITPLRWRVSMGIVNIRASSACFSFHCFVNMLFSRR